MSEKFSSGTINPKHNKQTNNEIYKINVKSTSSCHDFINIKSGISLRCAKKEMFFTSHSPLWRGVEIMTAAFFFIFAIIAACLNVCLSMQYHFQSYFFET